MQSNNPILNRVETHADYSQPMTVQGAIQKSVLLTVIAAVVGMALFLYCFMTLNISLAYAATLVGAIGGLILGLIATFKPNTARTLAIPYALFEGAFLGGVSVIFQLKYPGVPLQALSARTELSQQVQLQQRNLELAEKVERLTQVRYRYGAVALKTLLDQQETTRTARLTLVNTKQSQYNAYVTLMQALGGSPIQQLPK